MGIIEHYNIKEKVRKLKEDIEPQSCLELLAEECSEVIQAVMKLIRVSNEDEYGVYPVDKSKYNVKKCEKDLENEIMDVMTCVFLIYGDDYDVPNSLLGYDAINERLDKMIARIEENKNVH